jgi:hypothetical protein
MKMKTLTYQALRNFLRVEIRNEDQGGVRPATLGSALDSWEQAPDDVLRNWCGNNASLKEVEAELRALVKKHGAGEGVVHFV